MILGVSCMEPDDILQASNHLDGILVGRILVNAPSDVLPLRVMNVTQTPKTIAGGSVVALCEMASDVSVPVEEMEETDEQCFATRAVTTAELPKHLEMLFKCSSAGLSKEQCQVLREPLCEFFRLFSSGPDNIGSTNLVEHEIHTGDIAPIRQPAHRLPLTKKQEAERAVKEMESQGIIELSRSAWCSPVVLVTKKDGSMRFCVDYRKLNSVRKDSYPLSRIDDAVDSLIGSQWFSSLDLKSGYWQVQLSEDAKRKTAFSTGTGLWQFKVMSFGLCNAPARDF